LSAAWLNVRCSVRVGIQRLHGACDAFRPHSVCPYHQRHPSKSGCECVHVRCFPFCLCVYVLRLFIYFIALSWLFELTLVWLIPLFFCCLFRQEKQSYTILLILTDGCINDFDATRVRTIHTDMIFVGFLIHFLFLVQLIWILWLFQNLLLLYAVLLLFSRLRL
jgi:hypothetical protein